MAFRPPPALRQELEAIAKAEGRSSSAVLIEAMHDWVAKKRREQRRSADSAGDTTK
ncbi:hypothetical protein [Streptomyces sp. NBC_01237]|uniref:hypothetical protein n=1 Tax=Streptomyces sp. NBC_01237 TaxID=2903790 RepID=UPI002DD94FFF|nr:hypothetical protein [Streptomyces sp. NBC_01237]WRZ76593.1 ribbon-helix-helix domain-containing protein [Streptomyces sp. NBC_01237]